MFEKLSAKAIKVVMFAQEEARLLDSTFVETEHLLLGILKEGTSIAARLLFERDLNFESVAAFLKEKVKPGKSSLRFETQLSPHTRQAIELAMDEAEKLNESTVEPEHLLLGIVNLGEGIAISILKDAGINLSRMRWHILRFKENFMAQSELVTPTVDKLTTDLTLLIEQKEIHSSIGRDHLIEEIIQTLNLYNKVYPLLVGEPGSGKSSLIIGITQYLLDGKIYKNLQNYRILEFDFNSLLAEAISYEDINQLFRSFLTEIKQIKDLILVVDNLDNIFTEAFDKSGVYAIFLELVKKRDFYLIGICNRINYEESIISSNLKNYFQVVNVPESNHLETKMFLEHWQEKIGEYNDVDIDKSAIDAAVEFSRAYYPDRAYPAGALQLLDLAAARKNFLRSIAQARIKDMERHLRVLRNKKDTYLEEKNFEMLEEIRKEAQIYEEEIKILTVNIASSTRSTLSSRDVQLIVERKTKEEDK